MVQLSAILVRARIFYTRVKKYKAIVPIFKRLSIDVKEQYLRLQQHVMLLFYACQ